MGVEGVPACVRIWRPKAQFMGQLPGQVLGIAKVGVTIPDSYAIPETGGHKIDVAFVSRHDDFVIDFIKDQPGKHLL